MTIQPIDVATCAYCRQRRFQQSYGPIFLPSALLSYQKWSSVPLTISVSQQDLFLTMAPPTKRKKASKVANLTLATDRKLAKQAECRKETLVLKWEDIFDSLTAQKDTLTNRNGKARTFEENKMIILALIGYLELHLEMVKLGVQDHISWTTIEKKVAHSFSMKYEHVKELRQEFLVTGQVIVWKRKDVVTENVLDELVPIPPRNRSKLLPHHLLSLCQWVDKQHGEGRSVTNSKVQNFIRITFEIEITRRSVQRHFAQLGLSWKKIKTKKRTLDGYRIDAIRDFLIKLNDYVVGMETNNVVPVCTDESYLHNNHSSGNSYYRSTGFMGKSASKGKRLIILHAITPDGPLCERNEVTNVPYDDLQWNGDMPHPKDFEKRDQNEQQTCELLWISSSSKGDYHDNMNSDMYMKWIVEKLVPTYERLHPGKQMLLIQDNAPYHHKRGIPSLAGMTKRQLLDLAREHDVEFIDLPISVGRRNSMIGTDMGEFLRVEVDADTMGGMAGKKDHTYRM
jgi:transposase